MPKIPSMRVVCFVPSLTETLIEAGVEVVGRTRFCIHPQEKVKSIAVVGGTKDADWDKVKSLNPDLVIFDQEENTKEMAESCPVSYFGTHVQSFYDLAPELLRLANTVRAPELAKFAGRAEALVKRGPIKAKLPVLKDILPWTQKERTVLYVIWKNPWMVVSRDTFIGSVLELLEIRVPSYKNKYPEIEFKHYDPRETLVLFSSEPFPFAKFEKELKGLGYPSALVDGENFSWFGIRTIRFLESLV